MIKCELVTRPFSWNDKMGEEALNTLEELNHVLGYGTYQTLGVALAKLKILEEQGALVDESLLNDD